DRFQEATLSAPDNSLRAQGGCRAWVLCGRQRGTSLDESSGHPPAFQKLESMWGYCTTQDYSVSQKPKKGIPLVTFLILKIMLHVYVKRNNYISQRRFRLGRFRIRTEYIPGSEGGASSSDPCLLPDFLYVAELVAGDASEAARDPMQRFMTVGRRAVPHDSYLGPERIERGDRTRQRLSGVRQTKASRNCSAGPAARIHAVVISRAQTQNKEFPDKLRFDESETICGEKFTKVLLGVPGYSKGTPSVFGGFILSTTMDWLMGMLLLFY
ncbi:hypothetical protein JZ751_020849, partial [Albula glossodonta]